MDEFDFDEQEFDGPDDDEEHAAGSRVILRATVADGRVLAVLWSPDLVNYGPLTSLLRDREHEGVAIADIQVLREREAELEAVVEFMAAGPARAGAQQALRRWAKNVGYTRIWFPDGPVDLPNPAPQPRTAIVTCPTCGVEFVDSTPGFWSHVTSWGHFPTQCAVCGNGLPQWDVKAGDLTRCRGNVRGRSSSTRQSTKSGQGVPTRTAN